MQVLLEQEVSAQSESLADSWYQVLAPTGFSTFGPAEVRQQLIRLAHQMIKILGADSFEPIKARTIGKTLVDLGFNHPLALGKSQEILSRHATQIFPAELTPEANRRLYLLISELAIGFGEQSRRVILSQQEQISTAQRTERKRLVRELDKLRRKMAHVRMSTQLRWAQELHDSVVQDVLAISYQAHNLANDLGGGGGFSPSDSEPLVQIATEMRQRLLLVVRQLRNLIGMTHPAGLKELGLVAAIRGLVETLKGQSNSTPVEIHLDLDEEIDFQISNLLAFSVFRITQEALWNSMRHSQASIIRVRLNCEEDKIVLCVKDDGRGFKLPSGLNDLVAARHFGLAGMLERVDEAGGRLIVNSILGTGTEIFAEFPLEPKEERSKSGDG